MGPCEKGKNSFLDVQDQIQGRNPKNVEKSGDIFSLAVIWLKYLYVLSSKNGDICSFSVFSWGQATENGDCWLAVLFISHLSSTFSFLFPPIIHYAHSVIYHLCKNVI